MFAPPPKDSDGWEPNNYERDVEQLRRCIRLDQAPIEKIIQDNVELMDQFALNRKRIDHGLVRFTATQLLFSFTVAMACKCWDQLRIVVGRCLALHFWLCVVLAPFLLLVLLKTAFRSPPMPVNNIDADAYAGGKPFYSMFTRQFDPESRVWNVPLSLMEHWCSALPSLLLFRPFAFQLLGRLATWCALHHYPEQWYQLWNNNLHPKPQPLSLLAARFVTSILYSRWMIAVEVACLASAALKWKTIGAIYGLATVLCLSLASGARFVDPDNKGMQYLVIEKPVLRTFIRALLIAQAFKCWRQRKELSVALVNWCKRIRVSAVVSLVRYFVILVGPVCHIVASLRLFRIQHFHNKPIVSSSREDKGSSYTWRYTRKWRPAKKLSYTLRRWWDEIVHWYFWRGQVIDKLHNPGRYGQEEVDWTAPLQHMLAMNRAHQRDRSEWAQLLSEKVAKKHQENFDAGTKEVRCCIVA